MNSSYLNVISLTHPTSIFVWNYRGLTEQLSTFITRYRKPIYSFTLDTKVFFKHSADFFMTRSGYL